MFLEVGGEEFVGCRGIGEDFGVLVIDRKVVWRLNGCS